MKKLMFTLAIVSVAFTSVQAQKQLGGEHNVEASFNPFADNPIDASVIKYRKFLDDDAAVRVVLGLNNSNESWLVLPAEQMRTGYDQAQINNPDLFLTNQSSQWNLSVGYEKHFNGMDALSPYVAFQAGYGSSSVTLTRDHYSAVGLSQDPLITDGYWVAEFQPELWQAWSYSNEVKSTHLNLDLIFGADYYFSDAIYVGFETGLRFQNQNPTTTTLSASNDIAFNMYFDGQSVGPASGVTSATAFGNSAIEYADQTSDFYDPGNNFLVTYVPSDPNNPTGGGTWIVDNDVNFTFNGAPGAEWSGVNQDLVYAIDQIDSGNEFRTPWGLDRNGDNPTLFSSASSFLGTYSTGMLRLGFLID
jgi:hypothetical protein